MQKSVAVFLAAWFLFSGSICFAQTENAALVKTVITGIGKEISALSTSEVKRTLTISPCDQTRTVLLQQYDSKAGRYRTVHTYTTADAPVATVEITFPKSQRKRTVGQWRIKVKKSATARSAEKTVRVISKNIVKKDVSAKAACVYCVDDDYVLYQKRMHKRYKQASLTKLMTATLLLESGKTDDKTTISRKAAKTPYSTPTMKAGDVYTNRALLHALLLPSSNGAAVALAESVSGNTKSFVKKMNKKAKRLGLEDTHYCNPHGLDADNHYSSAYDTAVLTGYIYRESSVLRKVIAKKSYKVKSEKSKPVRIYTKDMLKDYSPKHCGGKTGRTTGAGYCFSGVYAHDGKTYVVCVLGSSSDSKRWNDMKKLYAYIDQYASTTY